MAGVWTGDQLFLRACLGYISAIGMRQARDHVYLHIVEKRAKSQGQDSRSRITPQTLYSPYWNDPLLIGIVSTRALMRRCNRKTIPIKVRRRGRRPAHLDHDADTPRCCFLFAYQFLSSGSATHLPRATVHVLITAWLI